MDTLPSEPRRKGGFNGSNLQFAIRDAAAALLLLATLAAPSQAQVTLTVNAGSVVRTVDSRMFGLNTADWDPGFINPQTPLTLATVQAAFLRYPGGSFSDDYNWQTNMNVVEGTTAGVSVFDDFAATAIANGSQAVITANYVTGTPDLAAAWVRYSKAQGYGFKYWEVGNECYGTWEYTPHLPSPAPQSPDPVAYATAAVQYIQQMKAADPTIKVGVVADSSEDSYRYHPSEAVTNPVTGLSHYGWTPIVLTTMKNLGTLPDFLIFHYYAQNEGSESDTGILQDAPVSWPANAAGLRMQLTDYLGAAGAGIELLVTENNSVDTNPGKQTTSLVNGLYMADSVCSLMQTEFNSLV